jgi:hypothetical protein
MRDKIFGQIITSLAVIGLIVEKATKVIIFKDLTLNQHYQAFEWILLLGLAIMIVSDSIKRNDERTQKKQLKSLQFTIIMFQIFMLSIGLTGITRGYINISLSEFLFIPILCIVLYFIYFHIVLAIKA